MSDVEIRINKRTIERGLYLIIIIVLAVFLYLKWDGTAAPDNTAELTACQTNLTSVQASLTTCTTNLEATETDLDACEDAIDGTDTTTTTTEPTPTPEPEPELSGVIEVDWDPDVDSSDHLTRVAWEINSGLDYTERVTYVLFWENFYEDTVKVTDTITVRSGDTETDVIDVSTSGFSGNPPDNVDTLIMEFYDSDGELIDVLEEVVR